MSTIGIIAAVGAVSANAATLTALKSAGSPESGSAIGQAVRTLTRTRPVDKVVVLSRNGYAAGLVAAAAIEQPVVAVHSDGAVARILNLVPGVRGVHVPTLAWRDADAGPDVLHELCQRRILDPGDVVQVVGANTGDDRRYLNSFQTFRVRSAGQERLTDDPPVPTAV